MAISAAPAQPWWLLTRGLRLPHPRQGQWLLSRSEQMNMGAAGRRSPGHPQGQGRTSERLCKLTTVCENGELRLMTAT